MFTPPFPMMVLPVFLGMYQDSAVVSGMGMGMLVVTLVVCCFGLLLLFATSLLISLAAISPPLGVRWMPSPLRMSRVSSSLIFFEIVVVVFSLARVKLYRLISLLLSLFFSDGRSSTDIVVCGKSFSSWLMVDAILFAILYPSLPYLMSLVPCEIITWS